MSDPALEHVWVCIAGGRDFDDYEYLCSCMESVKHLYWDKEIRVVSGAAKGADELGERWAADYGYVVDSHPPDYKKFEGAERYAPLARNEEMAEQADVLVAFWDGKSRGTRHMIGCAFKQGLEIHVFRYGDRGDEQGDFDFVDAER